MKINLQISSSKKFRPREYESDNDDVRSILTDICAHFSDDSKFLVSGFGQDQWPVDIRTDFPVFLEQLPMLLRAVCLRLPANLDFYEQGVERFLKLIPRDEDYLITCSSLSPWQPSPAFEVISMEQMKSVLLKAMSDFMCALVELSPDLAAHPWVHAWAEPAESVI